MPKMQVYLPRDLYERVKARGEELNVSSILQRALTAALAELERHEALGEAIHDYEAEFGPITDEEIDAQAEKDRKAARRPGRRRRSSAA